MIVQNIAVDKLIPYARNPRLNDNAVDSVAASIKEFGFLVPIVIDADNVVVAGHTRLKAANKLGLSEVPCIIAEDLTETQLQAFRIIDNKVAEKASWDFDLLQLELQELPDIDFDKFQINFPNFEFGKNDINEVYENMPEFENECIDGNKIIIHFHDDNGRVELSKLLNKPITSKTKSIWFPDDGEK